MIVEKRRYYSKRHPILVDPLPIKVNYPGLTTGVIFIDRE
jgi:hypothetical protein